MSPLTGENFFLCLAQVGLAFAGFSGLILTLRQDPSLAWSPREVAGLKFIFEHAFGMALYALLPFVLLYRLQRVWQISNALLAIFLATLFVTQTLRVKRTKKAGEGPAFPKQLIVFYIIPTAALSLIEVTRAFQGSLFWYSFGLLYLLIQGAVQFWVFLIIYTRPKPKGEDENAGSLSKTA